MDSITASAPSNLVRAISAALNSPACPVKPDQSESLLFQAKPHRTYDNCIAVLILGQNQDKRRDGVCWCYNVLDGSLNWGHYGHAAAKAAFADRTRSRSSMLHQQDIIPRIAHAIRWVPAEIVSSIQQIAH